MEVTTINEKYVFEYMRRHPGSLVDAVLFENKAIKAISVYQADFFSSYGKIPSNDELKMAIRNREVQHDMSESFLDTLQDGSSSYTDGYIEDQYNKWRDQRLTDTYVMRIVEVAKSRSGKKVTEEIRELASALHEKSTSLANRVGLFDVRTANDWIKLSNETIMPKKLLGGLWFEGEICLLFASTNVGKSALAVHVMDCLSRGTSLDSNSVFQNETEAHKILYLDFELSAKQFHIRATDDFTGDYKFNENFMRAEIKTTVDFKKAGFSSYEAYFNAELSRIIEKSGAKTLCIDNLSWLLTEGEKSDRAQAIMRYLKEVRDRYDLSIMVIAHTPKRDALKALGVNDLAGSAVLGNFASSMITIGKAVGDDNLRYIKQLKVRNENFTMASDNVAVCRLNKTSGLLKFSFLEFADEYQLLNVENRDKQLSDRDAKILELYKAGKLPPTISKETGYPRTTVTRVIERHAKPNDVPKKVESGLFTDIEKEFFNLTAELPAIKPNHD